MKSNKMIIRIHITRDVNLKKKNHEIRREGEILNRRFWIRYHVRETSRNNDLKIYKLKKRTK